MEKNTLESSEPLPLYIYSVYLADLLTYDVDSTESLIRHYKLGQRLTDEDIHEILRYKTEDNRRRALASRLLQRSLVSHIAKRHPLDTVIYRKHGGKPYADSSLLIDWNVSHDGLSLVLGMLFRRSSSDCHLGVDVMELNLPTRHANVFSLIQGLRNQLTDSELQWILTGKHDLCFRLHNGQSYDRDLRDEALLLKFFIVWTAKEAFLKASGSGIAYNLSRLKVSPNFSEQTSAAPFAQKRIIPEPTIVTEAQYQSLGALPSMILEKDNEPVQCRLVHLLCRLHSGHPPSVVCICVLPSYAVLPERPLKCGQPKMLTSSNENSSLFPIYTKQVQVQYRHFLFDTLVRDEQQWLRHDDNMSEVCNFCN